MVECELEVPPGSDKRNVPKEKLEWNEQTDRPLGQDLGRRPARPATRVL